MFIGVTRHLQDAGFTQVEVIQIYSRSEGLLPSNAIANEVCLCRQSSAAEITAAQSRVDVAICCSSYRRLVGLQYLSPRHMQILNYSLSNQGTQQDDSHVDTQPHPFYKVTSTRSTRSTMQSQDLISSSLSTCTWLFSAAHGRANHGPYPHTTQKKLVI